MEDNRVWVRRQQDMDNLALRIANLEKGHEDMHKKISEIHDKMTHARGFIAGGRFVIASFACLAGAMLASFYDDLMRVIRSIVN